MQGCILLYRCLFKTRHCPTTLTITSSLAILFLSIWSKLPNCMDLNSQLGKTKGRVSTPGLLLFCQINNCIKFTIVCQFNCFFFYMSFVLFLYFCLLVSFDLSKLNYLNTKKKILQHTKPRIL